MIVHQFLTSSFRGLTKRSSLVFLSLLALAAGCGGGGGGGGDVQTGVRVLHAAIDAVPVDLVVGGQTVPLVSGAAFAISSTYAPLPEGAVVLSLTRAHTPGDVVATQPVVVEAGQRLSVFLYGDNETFGLRTRVLLDAIPESPGGMALVRVVDGVTGAQSLRIVSAAGRSSGVLQSVEFGGATTYLAVPSGATRLTAVRAADGRSVGSVALDLQPGSAYTVLFAGEAEYYVKGVVYEDN